VAKDRLTLLVVDDEDSVRHFVAQTLGHDYEVMQAGDGMQALEIATK